MTLILTALLGPDLIVTASDRRISLNGITLDDEALKLIDYHRPSERLVVSYTGLAEFVGGMERIPIEHWLADTLACIPNEWPVGTALQHLTIALDKEVNRARKEWRLSPANTRLSVILAGFDKDSGQCIVGCISNFERLGTRLVPSKGASGPSAVPIGGSPIRRTIGNFTMSVAAYAGPRMCVMAHGDHRTVTPVAVNDLHRSLRHVMRRCLPLGAYAEVLAATIRNASIRSSLISAASVSCVAVRTEPMWEVGVHGAGIVSRSLPRIVSAGGQLQAWIVADQPTASEQSASEMIRSGLDLPLDDSSYRAFLRASAELQDLADFVRSLGIGVGRPGLTRRDLIFLQRAGFKRVSDLQQMLRDSKRWARDCIRECVEDVFPGERLTSVDINGLTTYLVVPYRYGTFTTEFLRRELGAHCAGKLMKFAERLRARD